MLPWACRPSIALNLDLGCIAWVQGNPPSAEKAVMFCCLITAGYCTGGRWGALIPHNVQSNLCVRLYPRYAPDSRSDSWADFAESCWLKRPPGRVAPVVLVIPVLPLLAGRWEPLPLWVTRGIWDRQATSFVVGSLTGSLVGLAGVSECSRHFRDPCLNWPGKRRCHCPYVGPVQRSWPAGGRS